MESFSIVLESPGQAELLNELWPKLDDYCEYEVFEYAGGNVVMATFEKYLLRIKSNLMTTITMDFTTDRQCQIDIVSGGGGESLLNFTWGSEKSIVSNVLQMFIDISEEKGWKIREDESEPAEKIE
jgi:hypothetical protein